MAGVMDGVGGRVGDATAGCTVREGGSSSRQAAPRADPPTILFLITRCPFLPPPPPSALLFLIVVFPTTSLCHPKLFSARRFASRGMNGEGGRGLFFCLNAPHHDLAAGNRNIEMRAMALRCAMETGSV